MASLEDLPLENPRSPSSSSSFSAGREALPPQQVFGRMIHLCGRDEYNRTAGRCATSGCNKKQAGERERSLQSQKVEISGEVGGDFRRPPEEEEESEEEQEGDTRSVSLSEVSIQEIIGCTLEEIGRVMLTLPNMSNLVVTCPPLPRVGAVLDPLFTSRKMIRFRVALSNVPSDEVDKACAAVAALMRLPRNGATYIGGRYNAQAHQKIGRVIKGVPSTLRDPPALIMVEMRVRLPIDWNLIQGLPQIQNISNYKEFNLLASGVENVVRHYIQIDRLGVFAPSGSCIRLNYHSFRCDLPYAVYTTRPRPGGDSQICGYHTISGINYVTETSRRNHGFMPPPYNFLRPMGNEEVE